MSLHIFRFLVTDCGVVAPHSSGREINELAPLISARAVYHAGSLWGYRAFADADSFVTARAY